MVEGALWRKWMFFYAPMALFLLFPATKEMVVVDRASHLFDGQTAEVGDALEELLADFSCPTR